MMALRLLPLAALFLQLCLPPYCAALPSDDLLPSRRPHTTDRRDITGFSARLRATRMSVVDFWDHETNGDGLNVKWAHHVNSWTLLKEHTREDPFKNKSLLIEGDVFLQPTHPAIPVMSLPARSRERITFKEWLREVAAAKKAIKVNFRTTEVVKPALQYLYAAQSSLQSPVTLHADIFKGPMSYEDPVDGQTFINQASRLFPDATISVGWTKTPEPNVLSMKQRRITWRHIFNILERTYDLHQPVMISVRLTMAANSHEQLLWLLGVRQTISLLVWSNDRDDVTDWHGILALREFTAADRIVYDLAKQHHDVLHSFGIFSQLRLVEDEGSFKRERWRAVQFINPTSVLSTIVESNESGPAFLGWPTAFLLSEHVPTRSSMSAPQTVSGRVLFVAKPGFVDTNPIGETGLSIFLLDNVADLPSPIIKGGIRVFIGHDGKVFIENRDAYTSQLRFLPKAISQMAVHDCYGFSVTDYNYEVQLSVWTDRCAGQAGDHAQPTPSWRRTLNLETPMTQRHRYVIVQKSGDAAVDCLVQDLDHNAATSPLLCSSVVSLLLMLPLLNFFQSV